MAPDQNRPDAEMYDHGSIQRRTAIVAPTAPDFPGKLRNSAQPVARSSPQRHDIAAALRSAQLAKDRSNASADVLRCSREWIGIEMRRNRGDRKAAVSIRTGIPLGYSHRM